MGALDGALTRGFSCHARNGKNILYALRAGCCAAIFLYRLANDIKNINQPQPVGKEGGHCLLICRVEHGRHTATQRIGMCGQR